MSDDFIPVAIPTLSGAEEEYVLKALRSSWISSTGGFIDLFEARFAELCATQHALSVSNGTVAIQLALLGMGLEAGDEVIVPSLTYIATANAVRYAGARPVFVDVDEQTWCMSPHLVEKAITPRTRGVLPVHLYGHPADMDPINDIARAHGLWVVEDAAEAHFATYKGRPVGSLSDVAAFSFFGNKIITCGEGGALTFNRPDLEKKMKMLRGQGMDPDKRYFFPIIGYNFRLTNLACALLVAQLERADSIIARRRAIASRYQDQLADLPGIGFQPVAEWANPAPWLFCITVDEIRYGKSRDQLMSHLKINGVDSRPFFVPVHSLPPYEEDARRQRCKLPVTDRLGATGMNLPTYFDLPDKGIDRIAATIREYATT